MELTINLIGLKLEVVLEETAKQKNVFGYDSISKSVALALGSTVEEIMCENSDHPNFYNFIKARNVIVSDIWGW